MGLFSRKRTFEYTLLLFDCIFRTFDDIATPFLPLVNFTIISSPRSQKVLDMERIWSDL